MIHRRVLHNDTLRDSSQPLLLPGQLGLLSGWGIFTTIRVVDGVLFAFDRHWARMKRDAELMRVPFPADAQVVKRVLLKLVEANECPNATMRVTMVRNRGGLWEGPGITREVDLIALTADTSRWSETVRLGLVKDARHAASPFAGTKVLSWGQNLTWYEQAHADGFDEVVLLNERGEVAECTSANVFAVQGSTVATPPLSAGCLPGITRNLLLEEVRVTGIDVVEKTLHPADLERADQVFITSTTRGLLPVAHIEGLSVRNQGDVCARLQQGFEDYVKRYVAAEELSWTGTR